MDQLDDKVNFDFIVKLMPPIILIKNQNDISKKLYNSKLFWWKQIQYEAGLAPSCSHAAQERQDLFLFFDSLGYYYIGDLDITWTHLWLIAAVVGFIMVIQDKKQ